MYPSCSASEPFLMPTWPSERAAQMSEELMSQLPSSTSGEEELALAGQFWVVFHVLFKRP